MNKPPVLHLDFETYAEVDLKKVGVENYMRSYGFTVTAVAWAFNDEHALNLAWPQAGLPSRVRDHIMSGGIIKAWNAAFEWHVLTYYYNIDVPFTQMDCVMQRALAYGLPAALQDAGEALNLNVVKDRTARLLMLQMSKPKRNGTAWHLDQSEKAAEMLHALGQYCQRDVEAERAIDRVIPPLHTFERGLSLADARINQKGVLIDIVAVSALAEAANLQKQKINAEATVLSHGAVASPGTETAKVLEWLRLQGVNFLPDLTKETVKQALQQATLPADARRMLVLRQQAAKASAAKLERMLGWASTHDYRARNLLQFYGAGRTGRWAGRGIQVQNLPRKPKGLDAQDVIEVAMQSPAALGLFHESPLDAIKGSLRACLVARPGHTLISVDLSQIEARVLAWLAGQADVVRAFREGNDVYILQAQKVGSSDRQLGKVLTLACGFGMGPDKFRDTAWEQYGVSMTRSDAVAYVAAWRQANDKIVGYWSTVAAAVSIAMGTPGTVQHLPKGMMVRKQGGVLEIRKPNTVKLRYHNMRWDGGDGMVFDGVDGTTKQWGKQRTYGGKLVENIVQSVARDIMAEAIMRAGPPWPIMTVHDEVVWEWPETTAGKAAIDRETAMEVVPTWAQGLPLASEVKISRRYGG